MTDLQRLWQWGPLLEKKYPVKMEAPGSDGELSHYVTITSLVTSVRFAGRICKTGELWGPHTKPDVPVSLTFSNVNHLSLALCVLDSFHLSIGRKKLSFSFDSVERTVSLEILGDVERPL